MSCYDSYEDKNCQRSNDDTFGRSMNNWTSTPIFDQIISNIDGIGVPYQYHPMYIMFQRPALYLNIRHYN